jgi:hypothetical protein
MPFSDYCNGADSDPIDKEEGSNQTMGDRYRVVCKVGLGQRWCHSPVRFGS